MATLFVEIFSSGIKPPRLVILNTRKEVKDMKDQNRNQQNPQNKNQQNCPTNQKNQPNPENKKKDAPESHKAPENKF